jgi:histidyl-tRNA synthetase
MGEEAQHLAFRLMCLLQRDGISVEIDYEGKSLKSQLRRADKFNSRYTLIIGDDELTQGRGQLKNMADGSQTETPFSVEEIARLLKN